MTELEALTDELAERIAADARAVSVPPVAQITARARRRGRARLAGAALALVVGSGAAAAVVDAAGTGERLEVVAGPPREVLLDEGVERDGPWRLVADPVERCIRLIHAAGRSGVCDLADPPRLDELSVQYVDELTGPFTLVSGLLPAGAAAVEVTGSTGDTDGATLVDDAYYVARLAGRVGVDSVVARDASGQVVARTTRVVPPPPTPQPDEDVHRPPVAPGIQAPPSTRLTGTDEFGRLVTVRRTADGLEVDVDRVDMLGGAEARAEAQARGQDFSNDYFLVNDNPRLRTYRVSPDVRVWGSIVLRRTPDVARVPLDDLLAFVQAAPDDDLTLFHLDVEDGLVVGIEEQYRP